LSLSYGYSRETSFFDNNRNLLKIDNLTFNNFRIIADLEYGFTNFLTFGFAFPFMMKNLSDTEDKLDASTTGLSDAEFKIRVGLINFKPINIVFLSDVKFPSGKTGIGDGSELPLGNGQMESSGGLLLSKNFRDFILITLMGKYTYRTETVAEYREVTIIDPNGIVVDVGNQLVDIGDNVNCASSFLFFKNSFVSPGILADFNYRFKTKIQGSAIPYFSEDTSIASGASNGYILTINPFIVFDISKNFEIYVGNSIPISGLRYPIVDLYNVDGLVGYINPTVGLTYFVD
jgi:hypothetical protein